MLAIIFVDLVPEGMEMVALPVDISGLLLGVALLALLDFSYLTLIFPASRSNGSLCSDECYHGFGYCHAQLA